MRELKQNIGFLGKEFRSVIGAKSLLFGRYVCLEGAASILAMTDPEPTKRNPALD
jgi:hypothetical protein